jgi:5-methylcytosine-specific restriction enzyme A
MPMRPPTFKPHGNGTAPALNGRQRSDLNRSSPRKRGYTAQWDRASLAFRGQHPLCLGCEAVGLVELSKQTDHVIPHKGDRVLFWDMSKWQAACDWHHDTVKKLLEAMYAQRKIEAAALWLNSPEAMGLTRHLLGGEGA